ncbi:MAG: hypothetical protein ABIO70_07825 [Pseudomonadota bacterium]
MPTLDEEPLPLEIPPEETFESCMAEFDDEVLWKEYGGVTKDFQAYQDTEEYRRRREERAEECRKKHPLTSAR